MHNHHTCMSDFQNQWPQNLGRLPFKSKENRKWSRFWKRDCKKERKNAKKSDYLGLAMLVVVTGFQSDQVSDIPLLYHEVHRLTSCLETMY